MATTEVRLSLNDALVARAQTHGVDLAALIEAALNRYLDDADQDMAATRRWAEENALMLEALAGGAEEAQAYPG